MLSDRLKSQIRHSVPEASHAAQENPFLEFLEDLVARVASLEDGTAAYDDTEVLASIADLEARVEALETPEE